jgi:DNA-binding NarL/FixJ family response regulator
MKYKIVLADDHEILRAGLKKLIDNEETMQVVAEASDGQELLERLEQLRCDMVILDLSMPNMDGLSALKEIRKKFPKIKIIVLTMQKDHEQFKQAMAGGASGFVLKGDAYGQLVMAIKMVFKDKKFVSPAAATLLTDRYIRSLDDEGEPSLEILTPKEKEVLKLLAKGHAGKSVAAQLKISVRTVETHRFNLTNKLGIKSTAGLTKYAISKGLI